MNLNEIRKLFVELSGRYDLVVDQVSWLDNGADRFIYSGVRMLDRLLGSRSHKSRFFRKLLADEFSVIFKNSLSVIDVFALYGDARTQLEKVDVNEMRELYGRALSNIDNGIPLHYCMATLRIQDGAGGEMVDSFWEGIDINDSPLQYNGILFYPPSIADVTLEIVGNFHADMFLEEDSENHWSVNEPMLLVHAALYYLEVSYRNSEGARDWLESIQRDVELLDKQMVEEETMHITQMRG